MIHNSEVSGSQVGALSIDLDAWAPDGHHGFDSDTVIETVIAITKHLYTGDNNVELRRYSGSPEIFQSTPRVFRYQVESDASPLQAANSRQQVDLASAQAGEPDSDTQPTFASMMKCLLLCFPDDAKYDDSVNRMLDSSKDDSSPPPFVLCFSNSTHERPARGTLYFLNTAYLEDAANHIVDTIEKVSQEILRNWQKPLETMDFLGPLNLDTIAQSVEAHPKRANACLHEILVEQARQRPDSIAVDAWDGSFTYAEVLHHSIELAVRLLDRRIAPEERISVCMDKSRWNPIAMFGIFFAGAVYVPFDIRVPRVRAKALIERLNARFVISDLSNVSKFQDLPVSILTFGEAVEKSCSRHTLDNLPKVSPSALACIFFTSGSTGVPKAVASEHRDMYLTVSELRKAFLLDDTCRLLQYAAYSFDVSLGDTISAFAAGACICIPSEEERLSNLPAAIDRFRATHACFTNTVISQMHPETVPSLRHVFIGGEAIDKSQYLLWKEYVDFNAIYGTTESEIWDVVATADDLSIDCKNLGRVPIGVRLWIVNPSDSGKLNPIGALGEILIEGPSLAREYLNDPQTTARKFIDAPEWLQEMRPDQELRAYKSGDMGFMNADGTVTFAGRVDTQVKLRGQRLELGEIEHSIRLASPDLDYVAVEAVSIPSRGSSKTLAAFLAVPHASSGDAKVLPMSVELGNSFLKLRRTLMASLPQYMVPPVFFPVNEMPRSTNGKLDRKTLRLWASTIEATAISQYYLSLRALRKPTTEEETSLLQHWASVLDMSKSTISIDDHFFQIGGDSMKAMCLVSDLRKDNKALTMDNMFNYPKLYDMASKIGVIQPETDDGHPEAFTLIPASHSTEDSLQHIAQACKVTKSSIVDIYPTTGVQEAVMAVSARRPSAYRQQAAFLLPESIDLKRFQSAIEKLVLAQSIFRTRIVVLPGLGAVQVIINNQEVVWNTGTSLKAYLQQDQDITMTYGESLSRFAIIEETGVHYLVWTFHHSVYDGWSLTLMCDEIHKIYEHGVVSSPIGYNCFICHTSRTKIREETMNFWRDQFPEVLEKYPSLPTSSYQPTPTQITSLDIKASRRTGSAITSATILQAAWAITIAQQTGANDALFGLALSGRDTPVSGVTQMIAPTVTTVPMKVNIDNTMTIAEFLNSVQKQVSQVKPFEHVGLPQIRSLSPEASSAVDFRNLLVIHVGNNNDFQGLYKCGIQFVSLKETDLQDIPLTIACTINTSNSVTVKAHYDPDVISVAQLQCLLHLFKHVASQLMLESTTKSVHEIDMLSDHDRHKYIEWHAVQPKNVRTTLHGLFKERVLQAPDAVATRGFDCILTYKQLDYLSDQLAQHLMTLGVTLETRILFCFEKSTWPIIAMLATLKCGATCVSVNPSHPYDRLKGLWEDVGAKVVLADEKNASRLSSFGPNVLTVNASYFEKCDAGLNKKHPEVFSTTAAFVVYTSGSTGKPKGSILEHRNLCTSLTAIAENSAMNSDTRTLQFSAYTFDAHILEIVGTLIHGGCVCVISEDERMNRLEEVIHRHQVNWSLLTPTVARLLSPDKIPSLQTLILSGEPLAQRDIDKWVDCLTLLNGLGPSECSILMCITKKLTRQSHASNIGFPIGCHVWITDRRRPEKLVPLGVVGELMLEGPIVGRGYVNRPKATAAAFIGAPSWAQKGSSQRVSSDARRFYRTGDLARLNMDGSISFIGRADLQVKIRGQRVEPGEIEHQLKVHASNIKEVAVEVIKMSTRGGMQVLAAFVQCEGNQEAIEGTSPFLGMEDHLRLEFGQLQQAMLKALPQYMVPSLFLPVRSLPVSPSGKLERKTLQEWVRQLSAQDIEQYFLRDKSSTSPPQTENERQLHKMWAQVLKLPEQSIGVNDNFFQVGGDSVTAMELIAMARASGISLSVADVFDLPRLDEMARIMVMPSGTATQASIVKPFELVPGTTNINQCTNDVATACSVSPELVEDVFPASPIQEAIMAISTYQPFSYIHQAVFELPDSLNVDRFKAAWTSLVAMQQIFRTRIVTNQTMGVVQVVLRSEIEWLTESSLEQYMQNDQAIPMTHGSQLSRWAIISNNNKRHFVFTIHHAIYDGWSLLKAYDEIKQVYLGESVQKSIPYRDFIQYLTGLEKPLSEQFWRDQFPTIVESYPQLPSAEYRPVPRLTKSTEIKMPSKADSNVTLSTVVQSAWALLTSRYTGEENALFGLTLSGRDAPVDGIANIMGPILTTVPVCIPIDHGSSVSDFLLQVQRQIAGIRSHQHTGLQHIRRLSEEARAAVNFRNLLIIHSVGDTDMGSALGMLGLKRIDQEELNLLNLALTLEVHIKVDTIQFSVQFDNHVIQDSQIDIMLSQLQHVVMELLSKQNRQKPIVDLDLISASEYQQLVNWNDSVPQIQPGTITELFASQVQANSNAIAIRAADSEYTYGQLDILAEALAVHLVKIGVAAEVPVVLCFRKSSLPIIVQLAVLKAGGYFISTVPEQPTERITDISNIAEATIMLCDEDNVARFSGQGRKVMAIDSTLLDQFTTQYSVPQDSLPTVQPSDAAIVVFTSGSTGTPKGVVLEHASLHASLKINGMRLMNLGSKTRTLQYAAYSFDASIFEIFGTLTNGGCVCIIGDDERTNIASLSQKCKDFDVNWAFMTPSVAKLLSPADFPSLQTVVLGGEKVTRQELDNWGSRTKLTVSWGPAECSMCVTEGTVTSEASNVGFVTGSRIWITEKDRPDRLMPVGCIGEILVEGPFVGREYFKNPQATQAAFITDPAWSRKDSSQARRMYRSGDLARMNPDGSISFIGRKDTQVKINGQRVELSEIEYVIRTNLPPGSEVVVEIAPIDNKSTLTAFISLKEFSPTEGETKYQVSNESMASLQAMLSDLEQSLSVKLPHYMVPAIYVPMAQIPKSASGKTDRKSLKEYASSLSRDCMCIRGVDLKKRAPTNEMESLLQSIWSRVLDCTLIGIDDTFTSLGGDSITAMQVVAECHKVGVNITVPLILGKKTIYETAPSCTKITPNTHTSESVLSLSSAQLSDFYRNRLPQIGVEKEDIEDVFPCSAMQEGILLAAHKDRSAYQVSSIWEIKPSSSMSDISFSQLQKAWEMLVSRHATLRTGIVEYAIDDGNFIQVVLKETPLRIKNLERKIQRASEAYDLVFPAEEAFWWHLPHLTVCQLESGGTVCRLDASHAMMDGTSVELLIAELIEILSGKETSKPKTDYKKFVDYEQSLSKAQGLSYWTDYLKNAQPCHFPVRKQSGESATGFGVRELPASLTNQIAPFCKRLGVTPSTLIQTLWSICLGAFTGSNDVCFGYMASTRDAPITGIDSAIGLFLSMQTCRVRLEGSVDKALRRVQEEIIEGLNYRNCSLASIHNALGFKDTPLFNTCLTITRGWTSEQAAQLSHAVEILELPVKSEYVVTLNANIDQSGVYVAINYQQSQIPDSYAESIASTLETILQSIMRQSMQPLEDVELLDPQSLDPTKLHSVQLSPSTAMVHELFEHQVHITPDSMAIDGVDGQLTYTEFNSLANDLAAYMTKIETHIGPKTPIVTCFRNSMWMMVSILAVLKTGGYCIPIRPDDSDSNISHICSQEKPAMILCDRHDVSRFTQEIHVESIDSLFFEELKSTPQSPSTSSFSSEDAAQVETQPTQPAFVFYTSNLAEKLESIVLNHQSVSSRLSIYAEQMKIDSATRALQLAAHVNGSSIIELFAPLVRGGCTVFVSDSDVQTRLAKVCNEKFVNWALMRPNLMKRLLPSDAPTIKTVVLDAEVVPSVSISAWNKHANMLVTWRAPECSIYATRDSATDAELSLNVAHATGCHLWVVEYGRPNRLLPFDCIGELLVEGPSLSREHIDGTRITDTYVKDPLWARGAEPRCFYRTGNLAMLNIDGTVTFVGQASTQIKVNGQRVQLDEIERQLQRCLPTDSEVVVDMAELYGNTSPTLTAFVKLGSPDTSGADKVGSDRTKSHPDSNQTAISVLQDMVSEIDQSLYKALPRFMVPAAYISMTSIPTTAHGLIDRKNLKTHARKLPQDAVCFRGRRTDKSQPITDTEKAIRSIWARVLSIPVDEIGMDDDFTSIGGDSMGAMKIVTECRKANIQITIFSLFGEGTVRTVAAACTETAAQQPQAPLPMVDRSSDTSPVQELVSGKTEEKRARDDSSPTASKPDTSYADLDALLADSMSSDVITDRNVQAILPLTPFQRVAVQGNLHNPPKHWNFLFLDLPVAANVEKVKSACQGIVDHFDILRTVFTKDKNGNLVQVVLKTLEPRIDLYESNKGDIVTMSDYICQQDLLAPRSLGDSFLRFILLGAPSARRLVIRLSHALYDGYSGGTVVDTFTKLYNEQPVAPVPDYAGFVRHVHAQNPQSYPYWSHLLGDTQLSSVPQIMPREECPTEQNTVVRVNKTVPQVSKGANRTAASTFTAACAMLLSSLTDSAEVVFGRLVSGRAGLDGDLTDVVGPCINIVPMRVHADQSQSFDQICHTIQTQSIASSKHEGVGLDELVQHCAKSWSAGATTYFPFLVQYDGASNLGEDPASSGSASFKVSAWDSLQVHSFPESLCIAAYPDDDVEGGMVVSVSAGSGYCTQEVIEKIHMELCEILGKFTTTVDV